MPSPHFRPLAVRIASSAHLLPGRRVSTREVCARAYPDRDPEQLVERCGIESRYFADPDMTHAQVACHVLQAALERASLAPEALERIIFVNSTGGDMRIPANANELCKKLGVSGSCDGFDLNNACMGFMSAFDLAARGVATGVGATAIVAVELLSRHIRPANPRSYAVLGDAASAVILAPAHELDDSAVLASWQRNEGEKRSVGLAGPERRDATIEFAANEKIAGEALYALTRSAEQALAQAQLTRDAIDWVVLHQPNGRILDRAAQALHIDASRLLRSVDRIGSVGCVSVPLGLDELLSSGRVTPGENILLVGVGAGMAYGAMIFRAGESSLQHVH